MGLNLKPRLLCQGARLAAAFLVFVGCIILLPVSSLVLAVVLYRKGKQRFPYRVVGISETENRVKVTRLLQIQ